MKSALVGFVTGLLILAAGGCGGEQCFPSGRLGSCCASDADCSGLVCIAEFPGGICTRDCSEDHSCPDDGQCVTFASSQMQMVMCLPSCASGRPPCRDGYRCELTGGAPEPMCLPR